MVITIGAFLNDMKDALSLVNGNNLGFEGAFEIGYTAGSKLGLIFLLGIGMFLYTRTKRRKLGYPVKGPKIIDYVLVSILSINFIFPLLSGRWVNGTGNDVLAFSYVTASLLAYAYTLFAKPEISSGTNLKNKRKKGVSKIRYES